MTDHAVIILRDKDTFLFIQRTATKRFFPNAWAFPSGTMEGDETPETTAIREAKEELGVTVTDPKHVGAIELPELDSRLQLVVCPIDSGTNITPDAAEIQAVRWSTFEAFFQEHADEEIGHGLVHLRKHLEMVEAIKKA